MEDISAEAAGAFNYYYYYYNYYYYYYYYYYRRTEEEDREGPRTRLMESLVLAYLILRGGGAKMIPMLR